MKRSQVIREFNKLYQLGIQKHYFDSFNISNIERTPENAKGITCTTKYTINKNLELEVGDFYEKYVSDKIFGICVYKKDDSGRLENYKYYEGENAFENIKRDFILYN